MKMKKKKKIHINYNDIVISFPPGLPTIPLYGFFKYNLVPEMYDLHTIRSSVKKLEKSTTTRTISATTQPKYERKI